MTTTTKTQDQSHLISGSPAGRPNLSLDEPGNERPKKHKEETVKQVTLSELGIIAAGVIVVGALLAGYWYFSDVSKYAIATAVSKNATEPDNGGPTAIPVAIPIPMAAPEGTASPKPDAIHDDIYFDFDRSRLRADAISTLQKHAETLKGESQWAVLVQGYTDQYGPSEYNRGLAQRRGEAVKQFLIELGLPQSSIKVVTLGKEGAICDEDSKECRRLNRRVHLEFRKVGSPQPKPAADLETVPKEVDQVEGADGVTEAGTMSR